MLIDFAEMLSGPAALPKPTVQKDVFIYLSKLESITVGTKVSDWCFQQLHNKQVGYWLEMAL